MRDPEPDPFFCCAASSDDLQASTIRTLLDMNRSPGTFDRRRVSSTPSPRSGARASCWSHSTASTSRSLSTSRTTRTRASASPGLTSTSAFPVVALFSSHTLLTCVAFPLCFRSPNRQFLHCVQGIANLAPNGSLDGGLMVLRGSKNLVSCTVTLSCAGNASSDRCSRAHSTTSASSSLTTSSPREAGPAPTRTCTIPRCWSG